jgi:hypothetical protein
MTEIRLTIIFAFVVLFWGWVLAIYIIMRGDLVMGIVGITALIPVTLMFWMKARKDWDS